MKRARVDESFNPVYPYDSTSTPAIPFVTPPFVSNDGLQENPPGILSLQIAKPLFFNTQRKIALSLGRGLAITSAGELENTQRIQSTPPLLLNSNTLSMNYSSPLTVLDNKLALNYLSPLRVVNDSLTFNFTSPLHVADGNLTFSYTSPLQVTNNSLALNYSAPLRLLNNSLTFTYANPFKIANSSLSLKLDYPSALRLNNNGSLQVIAGWGLGIAGNNDLYVKRQAPLAVYESGSNAGTLYLRLGPNSALRTVNDNLTLNTGQGLQITNNTLSVKLGNGLRFNNTGAIELAQ
ncbi:short fiber 2 [Rhesus adenovirus 57]|nr:short fiber 2 [Rhesus adenovirus 55]AUG71666.1 short fiber 2 [Rhesus adenovirus 57]